MEAGACDRAFARGPTANMAALADTLGGPVRFVQPRAQRQDDSGLPPLIEEVASASRIDGEALNGTDRDESRWLADRAEGWRRDDLSVAQRIEHLKAKVGRKFGMGQHGQIEVVSRKQRAQMPADFGRTQDHRFS